MMKGLCPLLLFLLMLLLLFNILPSSTTTLFRAVDQRSNFFYDLDNFYSAAAAAEGEGSIKHLY